MDKGSRFELEAWERPEGSPNPGHGVTAVLEGGRLLEKVLQGHSLQHKSPQLPMYLSHLHLLPFPPLMGSAHVFTCCRPCQILSPPRLILLPYSSVLTSYIVRPQAAASTTFVEGVLSPQRAKAMSARGRSIDQEGGQRYSAAALSLVFHPAHPLIPTLRADVRRLEVRRCREHAGCAILALEKALSHRDDAWHLQKMQQLMLYAARPCPPSLLPLQTIRNGFPGQAAAASVSKSLQVEGQAWFGGGADLTPAFLCEEDAREFHEFWHALCGRHQVCSSDSVLASAPPSSSQMKQQPAMGHCAIVPLWDISPNFSCL